jgi:hypothetical protein
MQEPPAVDISGGNHFLFLMRTPALGRQSSFDDGLKNSSEFNPPSRLRKFCDYFFQYREIFVFLCFGPIYPEKSLEC